MKTPDVEFRTVHIIGWRKTKLSIERNMFPVSRLQKNSWISVIFRHLWNNPKIFRKFPKIFRRFPEVFPVEIKMIIAVGGDRLHVLRKTDLILYLPATAVIWNITVWNEQKENFLWRIYSIICYCTYTK